MAIPTGYGTEVLKHSQIHNLGTSVTNLVGGTANHIYIVFFICFVEMSNQDNELLTMEILGGSNITVLESQQIGPKGTFTWTDKIVIVGTDLLKVNTVAAATVDVNCSYIDQDWTA